jgi:hypothetical protein
MKDRFGLNRTYVQGKRYAEGNSVGWRNAKHRAQWYMTLERYAASLWARPVDEIDTTAILGALQPLWQAKPEAKFLTFQCIDEYSVFSRLSLFGLISVMSYCSS